LLIKMKMFIASKGGYGYERLDMHHVKSAAD